MDRIVKRGYAPDDETEFGVAAVPRLRRAAQNLYYLLNQGYPVKGASVFVGNHYQLSERQRTALVRAVSSQQNIENRGNKELSDLPEGGVVHIDGFNTIITLEVALSGSLLLKCMDNTVRDLAALRGTYRPIDKTSQAIMMIGRELEKGGIGKAVFYLDSPVSNSGRLKEQIGALLGNFPFELQLEVIHNVDVTLESLENVITSDAIILDKCRSWFNLNRRIIAEEPGDYPFVDFTTGVV